MGARELLAELTEEGLRVTAEGDRLVIRPASKLTDAVRAALREAKPELLALLRRASRAPEAAEGAAEAWTDADIARFLDRRARLPGRCGNHRRAGLSMADVGRDLAAMLQRCPGFGAEGIT